MNSRGSFLCVLNLEKHFSRIGRHLSERVSDMDDNDDAELCEKVEEKVAYRQHVECGIVRKHKVVLDGNIVRDAHDDQSDEDQCKRPLCAEQNREEDQYVGKAHIDRGHRNRIQCPKDRKLAVGKLRHHDEAQGENDHARPEDRGRCYESEERMIREKIRVSEHQIDQHPQEGRIALIREKHHQGSECREDRVDDQYFRNGNTLRAVLYRSDRMPDIVHDRPQELRQRREAGTDLIDESGK